MIQFYRSEERQHTTGSWGMSSDVFFASAEERYLGFGNLVQLTHSVLNVDSGNAGMKLHRNMELVDIILAGSVGYQDSFGGTSTFPHNTLQVVSAGKGIYQLEVNAGTTEAEKLQIGFLPESLNKSPIKTKAMYDLRQHKNAFVELVSPNNPNSLSVRQRAAVLLGEFDKEQHIGYSLSDPSVGLFLHVVRGVVTVQNDILRRGDSAGILGEEQTLIHTAEPSTLLLIEVSVSE